jgi:hypothetical protein
MSTAPVVEKKRPARRSYRPPCVAEASPEARKQAAAILEVLAGVRTPADAAQAIGISLVRYYQREQRALRGLLRACEPAPRGKRAGDARRVVVLEKQVARLEAECRRQQALVRAAQRAMGLAPAACSVSKEPSTDGKRRRKRKPAVRALKMARALNAAEAAATPEPQPAEV